MGGMAFSLLYLAVRAVLLADMDEPAPVVVPEIGYPATVGRDDPTMPPFKPDSTSGIESAASPPPGQRGVNRRTRLNKPDPVSRCG
jgi:hypothetical protein